MSESELLPAPEFHWEAIGDDKWDREYQAFLRLKPDLLQSHSGKYVAVHEGRVVGSGDDQVKVALNAYAKFGYTPIYVGLVSDAPLQPVRIPSPQLLPRTK